MSFKPLVPPEKGTEIQNALYKFGKPTEYKKCKLIRYSSKYCETCIPLHLQELGHLEMILLIILFKNVKNSYLLHSALWNGTHLIDLKM